MKPITLVQPRHNYAPPTGEGHVYMPTSLLTAGARILEAGGEIEITDGNLEEPQIAHDRVGFNLLGPPYIPEVLDAARDVRKHARVIVGGQIISTLAPEQRVRVFGEDILNGNDDLVLARELELDQRAMKSAAQTSLIPAYETLSPEQLRKYLSHEIGFYLGQGCRYSCKFCIAVRTAIARDPFTGKELAVSETYRVPEVLERDLRYLVETAQSMGIDSLRMYLSNLDVFQSPDKLLEFAQIVKAIRKDHPDFTLTMRALSTVESFLKSHMEKPHVIRAIVEAGLDTVGFGVDGGDDKVLVSVRKGHNTMKKSKAVIQIAREEYGMTPEALMVFGHELDTPATLKRTVDFARRMMEQFGAIPRPHVAKDIAPGSNYWHDAHNKGRVETILREPKYFQALDFTALASSLSHPDEEMRALVNQRYLEMCALRHATTLAIYPIAPEFSDEQNEAHRQQNIGRFDH